MDVDANVIRRGRIRIALDNKDVDAIVKEIGEVDLADLAEVVDQKFRMVKNIWPDEDIPNNVLEILREAVMEDIRIWMRFNL